MLRARHRFTSFYNGFASKTEIVSAQYILLKRAFASKPEVSPYDLTSPELIEKCREQLFASQTCILPNFLTEKTITQLLTFANKEIEGTPHPGVTKSTVFYQDADESFPEGHPKKQLVTRSNLYITSDKIPMDFSLRQLQDDKMFQNFLESVTGLRLREYNCEISKFVFSVSGEGDHQDWHFDNNVLTLTFMLQKSDTGGALEVYPLIGRDNDQEVSQVLASSAYTVSSPVSQRPHREKLRFEYNVGDMILFFGRQSLHRCTVVGGNTKRIIAIISYNDKDDSSLPNATHMKKVYGL
eukprot:gnl/MRDRNA2_/MRDRNA2_115740_c0_seq1.p1 gnl/MRDRNA2_/MRDRNA2_115740_c0~~gnl/MRDRNA2_/MRDRNA2_115740_c0_seq1.p1  ORF type:complete len:297 (+),score=37.23 gnl/MRDRNA2_/MRDRNA2_115740_c0_seq1:83-973(+)